MPTYQRKPIDVVIDVRSKLEFWLGHLEGAVNVPVDVIAEKIGDVPNLTKNSRILLVCASGARSRAAQGILSSLGYVHVIDGGATSDAKANFAA